MAKANIKRIKFYRRYDKMLDELEARFGPSIPFEEFQKAVHAIMSANQHERNRRRTASWNIGKPGFNPPKGKPMSKYTWRKHKNRLRRKFRKHDLSE